MFLTTVCAPLQGPARVAVRRFRFQEAGIRRRPQRSLPARPASPAAASPLRTPGATISCREGFTSVVMSSGERRSTLSGNPGNPPVFQTA